MTNKKIHVSIFLTEIEKEILDYCADSKKISIAEYLRSLIREDYSKIKTMEALNETQNML